jgi:thymidylate kinase
MAAFLVTGNPGSGKTTLAEELSRRGLTAIDSDYVPRLCHYEDDAGNTYSRAEAPLTSDEEWLSTHRWVWSRARLQEVFKQHSDPVFICGIARNIRDVIDLFACVFLLRIDADTQEERLRAYDLSSPSSARNDAGRQQIRAGRPFFEAEMLELGAMAVDGNASTTAVADAILHLVSRYIAPNGDAAGH